MGCEFCLRAESPPFVLASPTCSFEKRIGVVGWNGPGQSFRLAFILLGGAAARLAGPSRQSNVGGEIYRIPSRQGTTSLDFAACVSAEPWDLHLTRNNLVQHLRH
jgi:hypothetical protein